MGENVVLESGKVFPKQYVVFRSLRGNLYSK